jgi:XTP/dITP diphosphohydrolase
MLDELNVTLCSLNDYSNIPEILEDGQTFLDNALKKARIVSEFTGETVLADDSGLEVGVLDGCPGIFSARYAGPNATDEENIQKLLEVLRGSLSVRPGFVPGGQSF